jgi:hypothetical protein
MNCQFVSERILPYVYLLTHKTTKQYYFGYRSANKVPSTSDLGKKYFTSSKTIKELGFENFEITILAEFFTKHDAFEFEFQLIQDNIDDKLNLNKALKGTLYPSRKFTTLEHRNNISKALKGKSKPLWSIEKQKLTRNKTIANMSSEERKAKFGFGGKKAQITIANMSSEERKAKFASFKDKHHNFDTRQKISENNKGKKHSLEAKLKMSLTKKGKKQSKEAIINRTKNFKNGGNPRAIPVIINGIQYDCKKEAMITLGINRRLLKKLLNL